MVHASQGSSKEDSAEGGGAKRARQRACGDADASRFAHHPHAPLASSSPYRLLAFAACALLGTVKMSCTSRDPQCGQRKRLSRRDSGKLLPLVHTSVSMSSLARHA
jgi:hypothetical protein